MFGAALRGVFKPYRTIPCPKPSGLGDSRGERAISFVEYVIFFERDVLDVDAV